MANTKKSGPQDKVTKKSTKAAAPKAEAKSAEPKEKRAAKAPAAPRAKLVERTLFASKGNYGQAWKLVDVAGLPLGRISSHIAVLLMGKHYPHYTPNNDTGDSVVVINCDKVKLTGDKWNQKEYNWHTGYAGGIKTMTAKEMLEKHPERLVEKAVWRMMPKSRGHMTRKWISKLHVYAGDKHPHIAQKPEAVKLPNLGIRSN